MDRYEKRKLNTLRLIQTAAAELIRQKGLENTNIEEIAEKADISRGTFYNHYSGRNDLLKDILTPLFRKAIDEVKTLTEEEAFSLDDILELCIGLWKHHSHHIGLMDPDSVIRSITPLEDMHKEYKHRFLLLFKRLAETGDIPSEGWEITGKLVYVTFIPILEVLKSQPNSEETFKKTVKATVFR